MSAANLKAANEVVAAGPDIETALARILRVDLLTTLIARIASEGDGRNADALAEIALLAEIVIEDALAAWRALQ